MWSGVFMVFPVVVMDKESPAAGGDAGDDAGGAAGARGKGSAAGADITPSVASARWTKASIIERETTSTARAARRSSTPSDTS